MQTTKKKYIFIFVTLCIIIVFLSLFFNLFDQKNNLDINQLDENMCKYHYLSLIKENFSNTSVILDIQYKNKGVSIFPNVKNILCIGKVVDYEINFYEEVGNLTYVKLNLYVFTHEKIINFLKLFLFISLILLSRLALFKGLLTRNTKILFLYFVLFLINLIFSLKFSIVNLIFEFIFYTALIVFIESETDKYVLVNKNHNISIDSLRAVAVIAVILNHFGFNSFSSGYLGVDLFFVISGYVITRKYINLRNNSIKSFYADFVFFRLRRIIPNLVFFIFVTSIFVYLLDYNYKNTLGVALFSIFAVSNIYLYVNSLDYFSTDSSLNSFTHTWSLGVEEQFYLIYPFLIYALVRKKIKKSSILALTVLSVILFYSLNIANPNATYYLLQYRFWQMALGCILIIYSEELKKLANFDIAVGGYPEIHPDSKNKQDDIDNLKRKIDSGADKIITQYFFDKDVFLRYRDEVIKAGIKVPVIPGIMPISNFKKIKNFSAMCGASIPEWVASEFTNLDQTPEVQQFVGASLASDLVKKLKKEEVNEFHFYTLNKYELTFAVCSRLLSLQSNLNNEQNKGEVRA